MLLSFQRPDAKKARPPRLHDPTALRKRRPRVARGRFGGGHGSYDLARPAPQRILAGRGGRRCGRWISQRGRGTVPREYARPARDPAGHGSRRLLPTRRFRSSTPRRRRTRRTMRLRKTRLAIAVLAWLALGPRLALLRLHDRAGAGSAAVRGRAARAAVERRDLRRRRQDGARRAALRPVPRARDTGTRSRP